MTVNQYSMPITVVIEADDTDSLANEIGDTIRDAIQNLLMDENFSGKVQYFDMTYNIYKRLMNDDD